MNHRRFVLLGIGGVAVLVVAMTVMGLNSNLTYYLYPSEAMEQRAEFPDGDRFRLAGIVAVGSLVDEGPDVSFDVTDGAAVVSVVLTGTPPPLFGEDVPVLLEGAWEDDVFYADTAIIRHDENYQVPDQGNYSGS